MIHHRQTQEVQLSQFDGAPREELLQSVDYFSKLQHGHSGMFVTPEFTNGRVAASWLANRITEHRATSRFPWTSCEKV